VATSRGLIGHVAAPLEAIIARQQAGKDSKKLVIGGIDAT
jgi:hypothetical protein